MPPTDLADILLSRTGELKSRSVTIGKHRTTIRMDDETWSALREITQRELLTINEICGLLAAKKPPELSFTVALRVFVLCYFREAATEKGHMKAGHTQIRRVRQIAEQLKSAGF